MEALDEPAIGAADLRLASLARDIENEIGIAHGFEPIRRRLGNRLSPAVYQRLKASFAARIGVSTSSPRPDCPKIEVCAGEPRAGNPEPPARSVVPWSPEFAAPGSSPGSRRE